MILWSAHHPSLRLKMMQIWREQQALDRGRAFVKSIMENEYEPIPDSDGMSVLRNVVKLETGKITGCGPSKHHNSVLAEMH